MYFKKSIVNIKESFKIVAIQVVKKVVNTDATVWQSLDTATKGVYSIYVFLPLERNEL